MSPTPAGVFARQVVSSSSVREPSSATMKVWTSLTSVDGCAVSMVSVPNAGDPRHASDAASSTRRLTPGDLELMEGGFACSVNGLSYLTRYHTRYRQLPVILATGYAH